MRDLPSHGLIAGALAFNVVLGALPCSAQEHRYDREYPHMDYVESAGQNRVTQLMESGVGSLFADERVEPLLEALSISTTSQVMVFSKTSLQSEFITPTSPRALYFNDDTYVAYVPGSGTIEVATFDPNLGPTFYVVRSTTEAAGLRRQNDQCLACHDSFSMTGGGVPRFLVGSGPTLANGELASHGSWLLTTDGTPLARRWGGWYVTGRRGPSSHFGNNPMADLSAPVESGSLLHAVPDAVAAERYPTRQSDIVALMVLQHQLDVQNRITRVMWEAERGDEGGTPERRARRLQEAIAALVDALVFQAAAKLESPIEGNAGFRQHFEAPDGRPVDRSLRTLNLETRLFEYPVSYVVYSDAIAGLPESIKSEVFEGIVTALDGLDETRWPSGAGAAAIEILDATHPDFRSWRSGPRP